MAASRNDIARGIFVRIAWGSAGGLQMVVLGRRPVFSAWTPGVRARTISSQDDSGRNEPLRTPRPSPRKTEPGEAREHHRPSRRLRHWSQEKTGDGVVCGGVVVEVDTVTDNVSAIIDRCRLRNWPIAAQDAAEIFVPTPVDDHKTASPPSSV